MNDVQKKIEEELLPFRVEKNVSPKITEYYYPHDKVEEIRAKYADELAEAELQEQRERTSLEGGDFHRGLDLLIFDGEIREATDSEIEAGNTLRSQVQAVVDSLPAKQKAEATALLEYRTTFRRTNPLLVQLAQALGMSDSDIDDFFEQA